MKTFLSDLSRVLRVTVLAALLTFGFRAALAATTTTWAPPTTAPGQQNIGTPITDGSTTQTRDGVLLINKGIATGLNYGTQLADSSGNALVGLNVGGVSIFSGGSVDNASLWQTVFPWVDGQNYIRGRTNVTGNVNVLGSLSLQSPASGTHSPLTFLPDSTSGSNWVYSPDLIPGNLWATQTLSVGASGWGSSLCINGDCRTAWPGGSSGTGAVTYYVVGAPIGQGVAVTSTKHEWHVFVSCTGGDHIVSGGVTPYAYDAGNTSPNDLSMIAYSGPSGFSSLFRDSATLNKPYTPALTNWYCGTVPLSNSLYNQNNDLNMNCYVLCSHQN